MSTLPCPCTQDTPEYMYEVLYGSSTESLSEGEYNGGVVRTQWNIKGLIPTYKISRESVASSLDLLPEQIYFLVSVIWNTSDSFHVFNAGKIRFIQIFDNLEDAQCLKDAIFEQHVHFKSTIEGKKTLQDQDFELIYKNSNHIEKMVSLLWNGYFDNINEIRISDIQLAPDIFHKHTYKQVL